MKIIIAVKQVPQRDCAVRKQHGTVDQRGGSLCARRSAPAETNAEALGAELAASRPICDNGWLPMNRQVGSSGQTVSPRLYLAVGISGVGDLFEVLPALTSAVQKAKVPA